ISRHFVPGGGRSRVVTTRKCSRAFSTPLTCFRCCMSSQCSVVPSDRVRMSLGATLVVILGYGLWQRRFGSDTGLVGQSVTLDGQKCAVIGILPPSFDFPRDIGAPEMPDIWAPFGAHPGHHDRGSHNFRAVARLKPDVTVEQAQANMETIAAR